MSEDSMRCRRAPELTFETGDELSRHKEALKVAIGALRELGLDYAHFTETVEKRVAAVLEPPEEFEEVSVERFYCPICNDTYSERGTDRCCDPDASLIKLTGTVKRPVKRPVVREAQVEGVTIAHGADKPASNYCFCDYPECHGKTGTLIFRWID